MPVPRADSFTLYSTHTANKILTMLFDQKEKLFEKSHKLLRIKSDLNGNKNLTQSPLKVDRYGHIPSRYGLDMYESTEKVSLSKSPVVKNKVVISK